MPDEIPGAKVCTSETLTTGSFGFFHHLGDSGLFHPHDKMVFRQCHHTACGFGNPLVGVFLRAGAGGEGVGVSLNPDGQFKFLRMRGPGDYTNPTLTQVNDYALCTSGTQPITNKLCTDARPLKRNHGVR